MSLRVHCTAGGVVGEVRREAWGSAFRGGAPERAVSSIYWAARAIPLNFPHPLRTAQGPQQLLQFIPDQETIADRLSDDRAD